MKQAIIILGVLVAIIAIIFGSVLPFYKARTYIYFLRTESGATKTVNEFKQSMGNVLDFYSPIGQEEVVRYLGNDILNVVLYGDNKEAADREMINYLTPYLFKNDPRHLILLGEYHRTLYLKYKTEADYQQSEEVYRKLLALGPKFPITLQNLFELYQTKDNKAGLKEIGETILKYWPDYQKIRDAIEKI